MQILFYTDDTPQIYAEGKGLFPEAPGRCPHSDCRVPLKMLKHGFYKRYVATKDFMGVICIRRYRCQLCGRTASMLPSFCIPRMLHAVCVVILTLLAAAEHGSVRYTATKWPERAPLMTRRHIIYYRKRIIRNRGHIQLALNLMSPAFVELKQIAGDKGWTREFLQAANKMNPPQFNAKYHGLTGSGFMSLHNNVA